MACNSTYLTLPVYKILLYYIITKNQQTNKKKKTKHFFFEISFGNMSKMEICKWKFLTHITTPK